MATITVKNIPDDVYAKVKASAQDQHRSINSYIIDLLANQSRSTPSAKSAIDLLEEMKRVQQRIGHLRLNDSLREVRDGNDLD